MFVRILTVLAIATATVFPAAGASGAEKQQKPEIVISVENMTPAGKPRQFQTPAGYVDWSPSSPVYKGDRLTVSFSMTEAVPIREVRVKLDGKSFTHLSKAPWQVTIDTGSLSAGSHTLQGEVRTRTSPIMYGFANFEFFVQTPPETLVKGTVQEFMGGATRTVSPPRRIDQSIQVRLRSLNPQIDRLIDQNQPVTLDQPVVFYIESDVQRWAYSVTRDDREVTSAGPMAKRVYLELAPKRGDQPGLLPGQLKLHVWGVRNDGTYSPPIDLPIVVR
ncbi:MAG: Ig-like domain-containing protein [Armatimonadetes bacterium]|nr:Ig-like domain-containing protein [Armatimonadota bacterium]